MSALPALPAPGQRRRLPLPAGSADALLIAGLAARGRLLVLTETAQAAARLAEEAAWFDPRLAVRLFPDWETLPYDPLSPHPDLVSERLEALWQASQGRLDLLIAPAATACQRLAPPDFLAAHAFLLEQGERLDVDALRARLTRAGYNAVNQVLSPGEFAVRGGIVDLFPSGSPLPFRIELLDDEVESLRTFDPDSQRTLYKVGEIRLLPAREFPLDEAGISRFRQNFRDCFEGDPSKSKLYKDVSNRLAPAGIEYYLPLFFEETATLFDYLPEAVSVVLHGQVQSALEGFWNDTQSRHRLLLGMRDRPVLAPDALFLTTDQFYGRLRAYGRLELLPSPSGTSPLGAARDEASAHRGGGAEAERLPDASVSPAPPPPEGEENPLLSTGPLAAGFAGRGQDPSLLSPRPAGPAPWAPDSTKCGSRAQRGMGHRPTEGAGVRQNVCPMQAFHPHPQPLSLRERGAYSTSPTPQPLGERGTAEAEGGRLPFSPAPDIAADRRADDPYARLRAHLASFDGTTLLLAESLGRRETMAGALAEYGLRPELVEGWPRPPLASPSATSPLGAGQHEVRPPSAARHGASAHRRGGGEAERLPDASVSASPPPPAGGGSFLLSTGPLAAGFIVTTAGIIDLEQPLAVFTETELYARAPGTRNGRAARQTQVEGLLRDLSELKIGDPVVHVQHGIGRYRGLTGMDLGDGGEEFLTLEFAGGDKLYVPVAHLHLIGRYMGGDPDSAPLHRLGSGQWEKARRRAMEKARDTAAELLDLYAQRAARQGHAFEVGQHDLAAFAEGFGFEETPDQLAAIAAVEQDMAAGRPMDRLVCGDVGFGKTEVALRAAFMAVAGGRQVAVLCPTTLLAEQHFQTFSDRFAEFPVRLAELSRFRTSKEVDAALAGLAEGRIDIAIGTHKLLSKDMRFKNLGLVIIDEEHRFGVRQKERLKALRAEVDVLTLTATPIPRTLAMSLEGIRDFSVIATAPQKRLAIKTFAQPWSEGLIREAALRELKRGGQIYFLHNEVESIEPMREKLQKLLPEARIAVAHGQMAERELEHVMRDFTHQRFNLLLCTTIIETGIDVPSANTIIINRADKFGLAQLHQLRGRVGRSHHQAYAYLLTPPGEARITAAAQKRLEAIRMMEDLGSGFYLAMHDLEIRGAGEVLGESQSGEMQEVGFNLFNDMLGAALKSLKEGREPDLEAPLAVTAEINLHLPALLPEDYCADVHERLVLYKRLANCDTQDDLKAMEEELIDRFGLPPRPARALLETHRLRIRTRPLGITRLDAGPKAISVQFRPNPPIDPLKLIELIQTRREYKLAGQDRLRIEVATADLDERLAALQGFFRVIA